MTVTTTETMQLNRAAREYYTLELAATNIDGTPVPDPGPWEASFDDGDTWVVGEPVTGQTSWWQWLVSGDKVTDPMPVGITLAATISTAWVVPIVRLVDNPEILAENAPAINITT